MNKFILSHGKLTAEGFLLLALRTPLDDLLEAWGFARSTRVGVKDFDERYFISAEDSERASHFLSRSEIAEIINELAGQRGFRSLEFRTRSVRIQTASHFATVEPLIERLTALLEPSNEPEKVDDEVTRLNRRFDLYSPNNGPVSVIGTLIFSLAFVTLSCWLSGSLLHPLRSQLILITINIPLVVAFAFFCRRKICAVHLPARALRIHGISTLILLTFCGAGFEIFLNSALDTTNSQEFRAAVIEKLPLLKIRTLAPESHTPLTFGVNENQYAHIAIGHSHEILEIHSGFFKQKWFSKHRLEY